MIGSDSLDNAYFQRLGRLIYDMANTETAVFVLLGILLGIKEVPFKMAFPEVTLVSAIPRVKRLLAYYKFDDHSGLPAGREVILTSLSKLNQIVKTRDSLIKVGVWVTSEGALSTDWLRSVPSEQVQGRRVSFDDLEAMLHDLARIRLNVSAFSMGLLGRERDLWGDLLHAGIWKYEPRSVIIKNESRTSY